MSRNLAAVITLWAMLAASSAIAGKVNMPKEGNFEFAWCYVAQGKAITSGDKLFVITYHGVANSHSDPTGRPFDQMGGRCYGTFATINGKSQGFGVCELADQDGDKWWMEYHDNAEGSGGTYTSALGTGKYEGMTLKGEYRSMTWPGTPDATFQGCNPNKGTYKLK